MSPCLESSGAQKQHGLVPCWSMKDWDWMTMADLKSYCTALALLCCRFYTCFSWMLHFRCNFFFLSAQPAMTDKVQHISVFISIDSFIFCTWDSLVWDKQSFSSVILCKTSEYIWIKWFVPLFFKLYWEEAFLLHCPLCYSVRWDSNVSCSLHFQVVGTGSEADTLANKKVEKSFLSRVLSSFDRFFHLLVTMTSYLISGGGVMAPSNSQIPNTANT